MSVCFRRSGSVYSMICLLGRHCYHLQVLASARQFGQVAVPDNAVFHGDEKKKYVDMFPQIVADLTADYPDIPEANSWLSKVMHHNVFGGVDTTSRLFLLAHRMLIPDGELNAAWRMAWCLQMLDGSLLVCDELMRRDETRLEENQWYVHSNLGLRAANDGLLLESGMYELLRKYFQKEAYYLRVMETFTQVTQMAVLGRCLEQRVRGEKGDVCLEMFTTSYLEDIATHLTAYHKMYLPVSLALTMGGHQECVQSSEFSKLILKMGVYCHYQEDVLSYLKNTQNSLGAIERGRCTWPAVVALSRANTQQTHTFQECYGRPGQENISAIKHIYQQMEVGNLFNDYKQEEIKHLSSDINKIQHKNIRNLLETIMDMFYGCTVK